MMKKNVIWNENLFMFRLINYFKISLPNVTLFYQPTMQSLMHMMHVGGRFPTQYNEVLNFTVEQYIEEIQKFLKAVGWQNKQLIFEPGRSVSGSCEETIVKVE